VITEDELEMLATLTVTGSPTIVGPGELVIPSGETAVFGDGGCSIGATLSEVKLVNHGTTTLFAALDALTGTVIGECLPRHRHIEFLKFLRTIDREVPKGLQIHLILDNYSTHKHQNVKEWLAKHPRFHLHFTPTASSWLNLIERWFGKLTDKAIRRGVFHSVPELINAIETYLNVNNENPEPFIWTATAEQILTKVQRGRATLTANTN
jgi:transposase